MISIENLKMVKESFFYKTQISAVISAHLLPTSYNRKNSIAEVFGELGRADCSERA